MVSIPSVLILARPLNCLITGLSVVVGALTAGIPPSSQRLFLAALAAALVTGAGNALNDVLDLEIDRVNRPGRPLPAGGLSPRQAVLAAVVLAVTGMLAAAAVSPVHLGITALVLAGLAAYSLRLKGTVLWGNLLVALLGAVAFPYGALTTGTLGRAWIPAGFAFLFHLGREIVKDIEDIAGDRAGHARTLPLVHGPRRAAGVAVAVFALLVPFTWVPWLTGAYGLRYLAAVLAVDLLLVWTTLCLIRRPTGLPDGRLGRLLKSGMLVGLLAIVLGELNR
ncbi:MAG: geranylgeranylglycerol-phosphate geranylgeranyltransferase [Candidatus Latescibacterota bacterium]